MNTYHRIILIIGIIALLIVTMGPPKTTRMDPDNHSRCSFRSQSK
jgi:hypothetical protein